MIDFIIGYFLGFMTIVATMGLALSLPQIIAKDCQEAEE